MVESPVNVVRLTPSGRGAVATLLVAGPGAVGMVDRLFHSRSGRPLAECSSQEVVVGRFGDSESIGEQIVVRRINHDEVQLHCHGGTAAVERIEQLLIDQGATSSSWENWTRHTYDDPIQAEAAVALAKASTRRTAGILLDQHQGALRRAIEKIEAALTAGDRNTALDTVDQLIGRSSLGLHLTKPWKVVLTGRPNTGKSSLMNALAGYQRAIVHQTPGTTRDVLTADTAIDGWPVVLTDTAGLRHSDHPIEEEGIRLAWEQVASADLVVFVSDAGLPFDEESQTLLAKISATTTHCSEEEISNACDRQSPLLIAHNKSDLPPAPGDRPDGLATSALTGEGIPALLRAIGGRLVPSPPEPGEPVPWTQHQLEHLQAMRSASLKDNTDGVLAAIRRFVS